MSSVYKLLSILKILIGIGLLVTLISMIVYEEYVISFISDFDLGFDKSGMPFRQKDCKFRQRSSDHIVTFKPAEFITPIAMKLLADAHYGTGLVPPDQQHILEKLDLRSLISCLQPGAVIFVDTTRLKKFFSIYYSKIKVPFVLVSGDSDSSAPAILDKEAFYEVFHHRNSPIIHWFAMNCDSNPDSARFSCIMNGISQWDGQREAMTKVYERNEGIIALNNSTRQNNGKISYQRRQMKVTRQRRQRGLIAAIDGQTSDERVRSISAVIKHNSTKNTKNPNYKRDSLNQTKNEGDLSRPLQPSENEYRRMALKNNTYSVLLSFNVKTNPTVRVPIWDAFCNGTQYKKIAYCIFDRMSTLDFYRLISRSRFVLSPHGRGIDCYRTYEALYLGAYVVVKTSSLDEIYKDLPVLIVNKWSDITETLLNETFHRFGSTRFDFDKLFTKYWFQKFRSFEYPSYSYSRKAEHALAAKIANLITK